MSFVAPERTFLHQNAPNKPFGNSIFQYLNKIKKNVRVGNGGVNNLNVAVKETHHGNVAHPLMHPFIDTT